MNSKLHKKLSERQEKGTLRSLSSFEGLVDFCSNDYLGLARERFEVSGPYGATGSRLISGNSQKAEEAERAIAQFFHAPSALMFNSGYDANLGVFGSIPQKGDTVFYDAQIHASVRDGLRLSLAKAHSFRHNDLDHLESKLQQMQSGTVYVAVESLYSMNGDLAPLAGLEALCDRYGAFLIVDEAHACGVLGSDGIGEFVPSNSTSSLKVVTFGKAFGSHGACVLCSPEMRSYLINFARSFIYTTALPVHVFEHNAAVLGRSDNDARRESLNRNVLYFRERMQSFALPSDARSPIQIVPIRNIEATKRLAEALQAEGLAVKPIFAPTVPEGEECLRICLHAFNTLAEIDRLILVLNA